jgi:hypothetical protein
VEELLGAAGEVVEHRGHDDAPVRLYDAAQFGQRFGRAFADGPDEPEGERNVKGVVGEW